MNRRIGFRNRAKNVSKLCVLLLTLSLVGCQEMKQGEYGIVYTDMPWFMGGGVQKKLVEPGEREVIFPWETLYRFDTTLKSISWDQGTQEEAQGANYVETRTRDGNEVDLSLTVLYHVDPKALRHVVQRVGTSDEKIKALVATVSRASIRNFMNELHTNDYFAPARRQAAVDRVKEALRRRLSPEGIEVVDVIYNDHRFERRRADGSIDRIYQEQIDRTQATNQNTERERKRVAVVEKDKERDFNEQQAKVNRTREEAEGYKRQAIMAGDAYLSSKRNEAEQILATGLAEVEGLKKQIEALSGPGGAALLRLAIVRELLKSNPQFLLVNTGAGGGGNLDLSKVDLNDLIRQTDLFGVAPELHKDSGQGAATKQKSTDGSADAVKAEKQAN